MLGFPLDYWHANFVISIKDALYKFVTLALEMVNLDTTACACICNKVDLNKCIF